MKTAMLFFFIVCSFSLFESADGFIGMARLASKIVNSNYFTSNYETVKSMVAAEYNTKDKWNCGAQKFDITEKMAMAISKGFCSKHAQELSDICGEHDECYGESRGREQCDFRFCEKLANIGKLPDCPMWLTEGMCNIVKVGGSIIYEDPKAIKAIRMSLATRKLHANITQ